MTPPTRHAVLALVLALAPSAWAGLAESPPDCPCDGPLVASFVHELRDGRHVTTTGIVVPAPIEEVVAVLADIKAYPRWLFTAPDGASALHDVTWDRASGALGLRIGSSDKGLVLAGTLEMARSEASTTVRAHGSAEDINEWRFELTARPDPSCAQRSVLTLRIELVFGLKARVFGGSAKSMPLLIALAARDDLAAAFVTTVERMQCLGLKSVSADSAGRPVISVEGKEPMTVLSCRPFELGVGAPRALAFGLAFGKAHALFSTAKKGKGDPSELLALASDAITGRHPILSWQLTVIGKENPVIVGEAPASIYVDAHLMPEGTGGMLSFRAGPMK